MSDNKHTILFDEDATSFRESYRELLTDAGFHVIEASTTLEALTILQRQPVDLILVDMRLKDNEDNNDVSGLEFARLPAFRQIPKIVLTAFSVSYDNLREVTGFSPEELPSVYTFVGKKEGPKPLIDAIRACLSNYDVVPTYKTPRLSFNKRIRLPETMRMRRRRS